MPQDYNIHGDILNNGSKNVLLMDLSCQRFGRALGNLLVNNPAHHPVPTLATFSALDSHFHILHSASFKTANPAGSSAKSCWPRWSVFQSSRAQRGSGEDAGAHSTFLSCMEGCPDGRKSCHWCVLAIISHLLALLSCPFPLVPRQHKLFPNHLYWSLQVFLSNVGTFFVGFWFY